MTYKPEITAQSFKLKKEHINWCIEFCNALLEQDYDWYRSFLNDHPVFSWDQLIILGRIKKDHKDLYDKIDQKFFKVDRELENKQEESELRQKFIENKQRCYNDGYDEGYHIIKKSVFKKDEKIVVGVPYIDMNLKPMRERYKCTLLISKERHKEFYSELISSLPFHTK